MSIKDVNGLALSEAQQVAIAEYYNQYINEDEEMPEGAPQFNLIRHLVEVLRWYFRNENWFIIGNLAIIQPYYNPVGPDVAIFKGMVEPLKRLDELPSWRMAEPNRPAPAVVFEIGSESTWRNDMAHKQGRYAQLGVREYFAYDPTEERLWQGARLQGWEYDEQQRPHPIRANSQGRLWSNQLNLWLADDRPKMRLYRQNGQEVLGQAEEEFIQRLVAEQRAASERAAKEVEQRARAVAEQRAATEQAAKEAERRARVEAEQREATERQARAAAEQREQAERQARAAAEQRATSERVAKEAEHRARAEADQRAASEQAAKEAEQQARAEAEQREVTEREARAAAEQREAAQHQALTKLRAKLLEQGIDPDKL